LLAATSRALPEAGELTFGGPVVGAVLVGAVLVGNDAAEVGAE
jgi:hypothetical protein